MGATFGDYTGATYQRPMCHEVTRMVQNAAHSTKCHMHDMYFDKRKCESLKPTERDFDEFFFHKVLTRS